MMTSCTLRAGTDVADEAPTTTAWGDCSRVQNSAYKGAGLYRQGGGGLQGERPTGVGPMGSRAYKGVGPMGNRAYRGGTIGGAGHTRGWGLWGQGIQGDGAYGGRAYKGVGPMGEQGIQGGGAYGGQSLQGWGYGGTGHTRGWGLEVGPRGADNVQRVTTE